ncbi:MAG TPA: histidine--tRNA ligase [Methylomirabilota bacterium]|nr:histidine--tRNA ligase [Methylomirabilota bacterium]
MKFQVPRGTRDILPGEVERWQWLEERSRAVMTLYGYREVRTPYFEATDLFVRSVGESTDIVRKELYTFQDRKGRSLTLRPEGTAPLVRSYLENPSLRSESPARLYYMGPMFRYERPQAGRYRQFWQIGAELLGSARPEADAEMIDLFRAILHDVGLRNVTVLLNSLGDAVCRPRYREAIRAYFKQFEERLCGDCKERLETNPLRILDCKVPSCAPVIAGAPSVLDSLCPECAEHFESVKRALTALGIPYQVAPRLVRGLDYYTRTVFEVHDAGLGAQNAVGGGGRYDQLVKDFGGPDTPAIGFSIGMERLLLAVGEESAPRAKGPDVSVIALEPGAAVEAQSLARVLRGQFEEPERRRALAVVVDTAGRSANSQMKWASKIGARWAVFVPKGPEGYAVRDMAKGVDEARQRSVEDLRRWLVEHRDLVESHP